MILCTNNFENSVKKRNFNKKYTFTIYVGRVWIVIGCFLFEKQTFNELSKVIGIQKYVLSQLFCMKYHQTGLKKSFI
jgi:hypothetical protein